MIKPILIAAGFVALLVGLEQWSKYLVETMLDYGVPVEVAPFFAFYRTYNDGVAFSLLSGFGVAGLIAISTTVLLFVLVIWYRNDHGGLPTNIGFALICAGAIGNLIDRSLYGYVIDFLQFHTANWSFAIFNIADVYISLGVAAIILDEFLAWKNSK